jgi:transcriptional regulator with XRE-family HTH domain
VTNLSTEFCFKIREARRAAKISQGELAAEVGCKQSAISMFEKGDGTKLNDEVIGRLSRKFGIEIETDGEGRVSQASIARTVGLHAPHTGFCPNGDCPSNRRYEVAGRAFAEPDCEAADPAGGRFCAVCGEVLERKCPNCGAAVHRGAVCSFCGEPYVVL